MPLSDYYKAQGKKKKRSEYDENEDASNILSVYEAADSGKISKGAAQNIRGNMISDSLDNRRRTADREAYKKKKKKNLKDMMD